MIIDTLHSTLIENADDLLWEIGLNSHTFSKAQRLSYISYLKNNINNKHSKIILNAVGYLMHTYFSQMDDEEKRRILHLLTSIDNNKATIIGEILEMIGILYKAAPADMKKSLYRYIMDASELCLVEPSAVISLCNCYSYMFDELDAELRIQMLSKLQSIFSQSKYSYLSESIELTLKSLSKGVNS